MTGRLRVLAAAALTAPAAAGPGKTLTVTASRSGYTVWDVPAGTVIDLYASAATGAGSYAGYYLEPVGAPPAAGLGYVWLKAFRHQGFRPFPVPLSAPPQPPADAAVRQWKLAAGRYRVHVFGDQAARLRLVFTGRAAAGTRSVARPTHVSGTAKDLPDLVPSAPVGTPDVAIATQPMHVRPNSLSFAAMFSVFEGVVHDTSLRHACIGRSPELRCATDPPSDVRPFKHWEAHLQGLRRDNVFAAAWYYYPGTLSPGEQTARYELTAPTGLERVAVATFTIAF